MAWRGFAADFAASVLVDMFGKGLALQKACDMARHWATSKGHQLSLDEFSLSDDKFPSLNAKAWDVKLVCLWLVPGQHGFVLLVGIISKPHPLGFSFQRFDFG